MGLLHQFVELVDEIGIDRLRRHEHQRHVLRLAGQKIALGDILDVLADVRAHPRQRRLARFVVARGAQRGEAFERELGVNGEQPGVAGQADDAIGAGSVGEGELELVSAHGQAVAHDRLHPPLTEGAAGLLVGENVLERHHFAGHLAHARLRRVDHGETFIELAQIFAGRLRLGVEPGAESRPDRIEPLGDDASKVRLPRPEPLRHAPDSPAEFGARLRKRGEARLDRLLPFVGDLPLAPSRGSSAP